MAIAEVFEPDAAEVKNDDFTVGSVEGDANAVLEQLRVRLLDLTLMNKVLNFKPAGPRVVRVIDELPDQLFTRLEQGAELELLPVPLPPTDHALHKKATSKSKKDRRSAGEACAEASGFKTSFDLPQSQRGQKLAAQHDDDAVQTMLLPGELETDLRVLFGEARNAIEEKGSNILYLIFGFLEWYESEDSTKAIHSPLVMLPVTLRRGEPDRKTGAYRFYISYTDEDVLSNISLQEKLRRDFKISLPEMEDEESPEDYFRRLEKEASLFPRWKIRSQVALGLLSFTKLFMYRDLDPKAWPKNEGPADHRLVRDLFGGGGGGDEYAGEYDFEAKESGGGNAARPLVIPPIIMDADSSQHSAIVDAMQGRTIVIEGPPGTGKSQTITNLIAAALAEGKSVLFVADKLTALQVVSRRLEDHGLGTFCLELHSDKTQKARMMDDIRKRIEIRGKLKEPRQLGDRLEALHAARKELNEYAQKMNMRHGLLGWTVHEILWGTQRRRTELGPSAATWQPIVLPNAHQIPFVRFEALKAGAQSFSRVIRDVRPEGAELAQHAFYGVWPRDPRPDAADHILRALQALFDASARAVGSVAGVRRQLDVPLPEDPTAVAAWIARVFHLRQLAEGSVLGAARHLETPESRQDLTNWCQAVEQYRERLNRLRAVAPDENTWSLLASSGGALGALEQEAGVATIVRLPQAVRGIHSLLERAERLIAMFADWLSEPKLPRTLDATSMVAELFGVIASVPIAVLAYRPATTGDAAAVIDTMTRQGLELQRERQELNAAFDLALLPDDPTKLETYAAAAATAGIFSFLSGDYRAAKRQFAVLSRGPVDTAHMANALRGLASHQKKARAFADNQEFQRVLGGSFRGLDTNFEALTAANGWQDQIREWARRHRAVSPRLGEVASAPTERIRELIEARAALALDFAALRTQLQELFTLKRQPISPYGRPIEEIHVSIETLAQQAVPVAALVSQLRLQEGATIADLQRLRVEVDNLRAFHGQLANAALPRRALEASFAFPVIDLAMVRRSLTFASEVWSVETPAPIRQAVLKEPSAAAIDRIHQMLVDARSALQTSAQTETAFLEVAAVAARHWYGTEAEPRTVEKVHERAARALEGRDSLPPWLAYLRARLALSNAGGDPIRDVVELNASADTTKLELAAELLVYASLAKQLFDQDPSLRRHEGLAHSTVREKFREYDLEVIRLQREQLAAKIDTRPVPEGVKGASAKNRTELALLTHELGKQKRHIPIRQLVNRAGEALRGLKPCFMMSPRSVAQYLEAGRHKFDMVIMDEASQLRPEDAIGAIVRGSQAVIVGDSKQLPPTSFFSGGAGDDDADDEEFIVETKESILDLAKTAFKPVRQLRWHYRSRHQSLIAFSNDRYYDGNLVVFPSPAEQTDDLGVKSVHVDDGLNIGGVNENEAKRVVASVLEHLRTRPNESFGVVAMNIKQKERISVLLDEALKDQPELRKSFDSEEGQGEGAFIKNLESVQGDERDVIFISVTYGRSKPGGKVPRTFGPLNGANGWRRLNVLFTRAKRRIVVFSSFQPEDLGDDDTMSRGAADLKAYLVFARTGRYVPAEATDRLPDSDFEIEVAKVLSDAGYPVVPQVGAAGYFIDLAVKHPKRTAEYILGVECDGAAYHSSFSARDRDRLRQQVLEGLGWKIHRIWSTDWFRDPAGQRKRLLDAAADSGDSSRRIQP